MEITMLCDLMRAAHFLTPSPTPFILKFCSLEQLRV